jgi:hypothetical protein
MTTKFKDKLDVKHIAAPAPNADPYLRRAVLIHNQAMTAIENFHSIFKEKAQAKGTPGAEDHDLLRAMLLFACAGLDAVVKQLIRDALERVLEHDDGAQQEFKKFAERRLKRASINAEGQRSGGAFADVELLAELLVSFDARDKLIELLTETLVAESLQSRDQLLKVAGHFALTRGEVMAQSDITREAFEARNQIQHEMDIDLEHNQRRRQRSYDDMVKWCENIAEVSRCFIDRVGEKA